MNFIEFQDKVQESTEEAEDDEQWDEDSVSAGENGADLCDSEARIGMAGIWGIVGNL